MFTMYSLELLSAGKKKKRLFAPVLMSSHSLLRVSGISLRHGFKYYRGEQ